MTSKLKDRQQKLTLIDYVLSSPIVYKCTVIVCYLTNLTSPEPNRAYEYIIEFFSHIYIVHTNNQQGLLLLYIFKKTIPMNMIDLRPDPS